MDLLCPVASRLGGTATGVICPAAKTQKVIGVTHNCFKIIKNRKTSHQMKREASCMRGQDLCGPKTGYHHETPACQLICFGSGDTELLRRNDVPETEDFPKSE